MGNPFDAAAKQLREDLDAAAPKPPAANPFDAAAAELAQEDGDEKDFRASLKDSFERSLRGNVQKEAGVLSLASKLKVRSRDIEDNFDEMRTSYEAAQFDSDRWIRENRHLANMLRKGRPLAPTVMLEEGIWTRLARGLSKWNTDWSAPFDAPGQTAPKSFKENLRSMVPSLADPLPPRPAIRDESADSNVFVKTGAAVSRSWQQAGGDMLYAKKALGLTDYADEKRIVDLERDETPRDYNVGTFEAPLVNAGEIAVSMGGSIVGGVLFGGLASRFTRNPKVIERAARLGSSLLSAPQEFGSSYREFSRAKTDDGQTIDPKTARDFALLYTAASSAIEGLFGDPVLNALGEAGKFLQAGNKKAFLAAALKDRRLSGLAREMGQRALSGAKDESIEEVLQGAAQAFAGHMAKTVEAGGSQDFDTVGFAAEQLETAAKTFSGTLVLGAGGTITNATAQEAVRVVNRMGSMRRGEKAEAVADALANGLAAQADPVAIAELIGKASEDGGERISAFHLDTGEVQRFFQGKGLELEQGLVDLMGADGPQRLQEAIQTGTKLQVPIAEYAEKWAKNPIHEALAGHRTVRAKDDTRAQVERDLENQAKLEEQSQAIVEEFEKAQKEGKEIPTTGPLEADLVDRLRKGLKENGYSDAEATHNINVHVRGLRQIALKGGTTIEEHLANNRVEIAPNGKVDFEKMTEEQLAAAGVRKRLLDDTFDFEEFDGEDAAPPGDETEQEKARAFISRMRNPEKQAEYEAWFAYATGATEERPRVSNDTERELAIYGVVDPVHGYNFSEAGRDLAIMPTKSVKDRAKKGGGKGANWMRADNAQEVQLRKNRAVAAGIDDGGHYEQGAIAGLEAMLDGKVEPLQLDKAKIAADAGVQLEDADAVHRFALDKHRAEVDGKKIETPYPTHDGLTLIVSGEGIGDTRNVGGFSLETRAALIALPQVIANSRLISHGPPTARAKKKHPSVVGAKVFVAPLVIDGKQYAARILVHERPGKDRFYNLKSVEIKEPGAEGANAPAATKQPELVSQQPGTQSVTPGETSGQSKQGTPLLRDFLKGIKDESGELVLNPDGSVNRPVTFYQSAPTTGPVWHSPALKAAIGAKQAKGDAKSWMAVLSKTPGVKLEELDVVGLKEWLEAQKGTITREAVAEFIQANTIQIEEKVLGEKSPAPELTTEQRKAAEKDTWFLQDNGVSVDFNTEAGTVRFAYAGESDLHPAEVVRQMEHTDVTQEARRSLYQAMNRFVDLMKDAHAPLDNPAQYGKYKTEGATEGSYRELLLYVPGAEGYRAPHFDDHNEGLTAHARFQEHTTADGEKVMLIEEVQSDLHQSGREHGYADPAAVQARERLQNAERDFSAYVQQIVPSSNAAHDAVLDMARGDEGGAIAALMYGGLSMDAAKAELERPAFKAHAKTIQEAYAARSKVGDPKGVPDAPYKESWEPMVVRRLMRWAAEKGYSKIAWTTGETQVDRYGMASHVQALRYEPKAKALSVVDKNGSTQKHENVAPESLPEFIGREAAQTLLAAPPTPMYRLTTGAEFSAETGSVGAWEDTDFIVVSPDGRVVATHEDRAKAEQSFADWNDGHESAHVLTGLDLKVGGEGMRIAYDKRIPGAVEKLIKKHGGKVGKERLGAETKIEQGEEDWTLTYGGQKFYFYTEKEAQQKAAELAGEEVWTATLPEAYRKQVFEEGVPLFQDKRGAVDITRRGTQKVYSIFLGNKSDSSTFLHESGHVFLDMLKEMSTVAGATEALRSDWEATKKYLGVGEDGTLTVDQHEKWARSFEAYLMEGKAPSPELATAFKRFKEWLLEIYRAVKNLDVELNDEIRGVFDRLLATDEEIKRTVQDMGLDRRVFRSPEEAGMSPEEWKEHLSSREIATSNAVRRTELRLLKDQLRTAERTWKSEEKALRKGAETEWQERADVRAWKLLRHGELTWKSDGGVTRSTQMGAQKLDREAVVAILSEERAEALGRVARTATAPQKAKRDTTAEIQRAADATRLDVLFGADEGERGTHPDEFAEMFGYPTGKAFLEALLSVPEKAKWTQNLARERMLERHPDLLDDKQKLAELVAKGLHGDETAAWLIREWRALKAKAGQNGAPPIEAVKRAAEKIVAGRKLNALDVNRTLKAERSAAEKAALAATKGAYAQAYTFKQQQLLNMFIHREASAALAERESFEGLLRKNVDRKARERLGLAGRSFVGTADAITEALGAKAPEPDVSQREGLDALVQALDALELPAAFDVGSIRALLASPRPWKTLTVTEMRAVSDALIQIRKVANGIQKVNLGNREVDAAAVAGAIEDEAAVYNPKTKPQAPKSDSQKPWHFDYRQTWEGAKAAMVEPEEIFRAMGKTAHEFFFRGYLGARNAENALAQKVLTFFEKTWDALPEEMQRRRYDTVDSSALPYPADVNRTGATDRQWAWMVALNMGNASNKQRLLGGYKWSEEQVMDFLNATLSKEEWQFVQGVWDMLDKELFPEVAQAYERANGLPPPKIPATALVTPHGILRGGYFPAKYDPVAARLGLKQGEEGIRASAGSARASVSKSFTKGRVENFEDVIDLQWGGVPGHVAQTIHFATHDQFVREAQRMLSRPEIRTTIQQRLGLPYEAQVDSWLKAVAGTKDDAARQLEGLASIMGGFRSRFVMATLGGSLRVMVGDLGNYLMAMATGDVKPQRLAQALVTLPTNFKARRAQALALSSELRHRGEEYASKLKQDLANVGASGNAGVMEKFREFMFEGFRWTDILTSTPIWEARFHEERQAGKSEAEAVQIADDMIRSSFPSASSAEQSSLLRDKKSIGSLLAFFGYFSKTGNKLFVGLPRAARLEILEMGENGGTAEKSLTYAKLAGRVMAALIVLGPINALLSGQGAEDDEDEGEWWMRKTLSAPASLIPGVGGMLEPAIGMLSAATFGEKYKYRPITSRSAPVISGVENMAKALYSAANSKDGAEQFWALAEAMAVGFKLPVNQPRRTLSGLGHVAEEDTSVTDLPRAVIYGKPRR